MLAELYPFHHPLATKGRPFAETAGAGRRAGDPLVIAGAAAYSDRVQYVRALALICFAFGLFVQVAAQASAMPQVQVQASGTMDCAEMAHSGNADAQMQPEVEGGPCGKTLECLIAMNCIPPIALAEPAAADAPFHAIGAPYQPHGIAWLNGAPLPPESPPPQPALTA